MWPTCQPPSSFFSLFPKPNGEREAASGRRGDWQKKWGLAGDEPGREGVRRPKREGGEAAGVPGREGEVDDERGC